MYTATLALDRAWLVDVLNPTVGAFSCGTRQTSTDTDATDGEFRFLAGGRTQIIEKDAVSYTWPIELACITAAQLNQVKLWKGRLLCVRTIDGTRQFGGLLSYTVKRYYRMTMPDGTTNGYDCDIVLTSVTYPEAV